MLSFGHPGTKPDSGLAGCAFLSRTGHLTASDFPKIRAQIASSRWLDLRAAGTAYADLLTRLRAARGTTDTRPSRSTSGSPPPAPGTDGH